MQPLVSQEAQLNAGMVLGTSWTSREASALQAVQEVRY